MKVMLISANRLTTPYPVYPLGLDHIAGALSPVHQVKIADINVIGADTNLHEQISAFAPHIIGLSLRNVDNTDQTRPSGFIEAYLRLVDTIRNASAAPLVLGGSGFTIFPAPLMALLEADYGIMGEGERLALLIDALEKGQDVRKITGIVIGQTIIPAPPWPHAFDRAIDLQAEHLGFYLKQGGMLNLQTKRGCPFQCIYCTYPHIEGKSLRRIEPALAAKIAKKLQTAGAKYLSITDAVFNADYDHSTAVAKAFRRAGLTIPWGAFFTPAHLPEGYFQTLADCGLTHVEFGTESMANPVLAAYGKPFRTDEVWRAHDCATSAGLHVAHFLLLGGPGENKRTLTETLANIDKLKQTVLFFFCGMRIYPHTPLYELAYKTGQITKADSLLTPVFYQSPEIGGREIMDLVNRASKGRRNWILGSGGDETKNIVSQLYANGRTGPLWEYLIR
jgi:radical SAM superfamily enzyme YgiQ (UPF0313 family)